MKRILFAAFVLTLSLAACKTAETPISGPAADQAPEPATAEPTAADDPLALDAALPLADEIRTGVLENGLRYYLRRNSEPEARAELRLAIDAGSVLEDDDQRGVAHFLEHMLFNGTRRFEEQELVNFLERTGMRFGPDVNAYTSFDETVYMLTIPTDSVEIVSKSFDVLEDWAAYATLSPEEIEKERGVIIEEWRMRQQNAQGRILEKQLPVLLADSRYRHRLPIGDTTIIRNAPAEAFQRFYRTWYRPDLMAVVAVGDFDLDTIESHIRDRFATLSAPEAPTPRPSIDVPGHEETLFAIVTDPEYPYSTAQVAFKKAAEDVETVADYRHMLIGQLFRSLLNDRLSEIARAADAPFLGAGVSEGGIARTAAFTSIGAQVRDGEVLSGLEAVLTEIARVRQHGFTATELERQQRETLRGYERLFNERDNTNSAAYANELVSHFLEDEPAPGIGYEYDLAQRYLPTITLDDVNRRAAELLTEQNRVVLVTMPEKPSLTPPTEAQLAGVFDNVNAADIAPYEDDVSDLPLLSQVPPPAAVTHQATIDALGVTELTLANGVRVVLKPTDFKQDEVRFTATSPGGSSLASEADALEAQYAATLVTQSGVGPFDRTQLQKLLAGKAVGVSPYVGELEEGLRGQASPNDLETLFQLIHLYFTAPRADSSALAVFKNQVGAYLANRSATPQAALQDTLIAALYDNHPRRRVPTMAEIQDLDLGAAARVYADRFADASDFTFIFVGNFDTEQLTGLAQTYLGTLPAMSREEAWRDVYPDMPEGVVVRTVEKGLADRSTVQLMFHGDFAYTRENRHAVRSLAEVLSIRLREELREERGGVYGVQVAPTTSDAPDARYQINVSFTTDPDRVDELIAAAFDVIEQLKTEGPTADDIAKVTEQQRRERETQLEENGFWLSVLDFYATHPEEDVLDVLAYTELIEGLMVEQIQEAARQYLVRDRYVQAVLNPEEQPTGE